MKYYIEALKKYAQFSGRSNRQEFWMFFLINALIIVLLVIIDTMVLGNTDSEKSAIVNLYNLATLIPYLAASVRRIHDVGKNGWFIMIPFYNLYLLISKGDSSDNEYGSVPN